MLFVLLFAQINCNSEPESSFILKTAFNRDFTLSKPDIYLNRNYNIFANIYNHFFNSKRVNDANNKNWYYVHFLSNDISKITKMLNINQTNEITKDSFALYLSKDQLQQISDISLVKKIDPIDKIYLDKSIETTNNLLITTSSDFEPISLNEYYEIKKINDDDNSYIISINPHNLNEEELINKKLEIVKTLSEIPQVKMISIFKEPNLKNSVISGFTQKNRYDFEQDKNIYYFKLDRYLNQNGLNGENQIITIMDSPVDIYHSMFRDDKVEIEINKSMPTHRKIVYIGFEGDLDDFKKSITNNEHGTHTSGTAAGKNECINDVYGANNFNGNAPEAKILLPIYAPLPVINDIQRLMKEFNSTISSNSWGSTDYFHPFNFIYGNIAQSNPQSVFIFAAGNEYFKLNGNFSVCDPGGSKNVLAVGAIDNFYEYDAALQILESIDDPEISFNINRYRGHYDPWIVGTIGTEKGKSQILLVDMSQGEQCDKISGDQTSILYGEISDWYKSCNYTQNSQIFYAPSEENIKKLLKVGGKVSIIPYLNIDKQKGITKAGFSSTGPGNHGILKPDVMAPGSRVISSKSRANNTTPHGCMDNVVDDFIFMDGTSMATPNVAGGMALVHQYFNTGRWIEKVNLDGPTSRALIINSCTHPFGSKRPDIFYGHGVVDLSTILPIENDFGVQITHQGEDVLIEKHSVLSNGHVVSKLKVESNANKKKLQITLSYLDIILELESFIPLSRDLDLIVISPSKKAYFGDHLESNDTQHASTNEKIIIDADEVEIGEYTIHVYGGFFVDSDLTNENLRQSFSVVATGPITNGYLEFEESNECPCDKCDPNKPGYCLCNETESIGQMCQVKIENVIGKNGNLTVGPLEMKRMRFVSDKNIKSITVRSDKPGRDISVLASPKCHLDFVKYDVNGKAGNETNPITTETNFGTNEICVDIFNFNDVDATYFIELNDAKNKKKSKTGMIIGITIAVVAFVAIIIITVLCCLKRKNMTKTAVADKTLLNDTI